MEVTDYLDRDPALARHVVPGEPDVQAEFAYQRDREMALILPPGGGDLSHLSGATADPRAKQTLELAAMIKDMLGG